jgi:deazaflavin-dependent oxidoreductase (nitroreductase family)
VEVPTMNPVVKRLMSWGSKLMVSLYRRSGGRIGGRVRGTPVLLLTVPGRTTGIPRTAAVGYFEHLGGYLVTGTAGGMPQDPQWFKNLSAADHAEVVIGRGPSFQADIRELTGDERAHVWREVVVGRSPSFAGYETKTTRTIPIALLTPRTAHPRPS